MEEELKVVRGSDIQGNSEDYIPIIVEPDNALIERYRAKIASLTAALDAARRELADALGLLASAQAVREGMPGPEWVRVEDGLPEVNEVRWSDDVLLAYKVIGCAYHGAQTVSRYHYDRAAEKYVWSYSNYVLGDWGYEAYAWMPLPKGPEVSHD